MARAKRDTDNEAAASDVDGTSAVTSSTPLAKAPPVTSRNNPPLQDLLASAEANRKERASGAHQAAQRLLTKMFNKRVV